ncbi:glycosyltransferase family 39 protein [Candidatus Gottesmanbacteria bacterium]|nr:glycosyltransferase family 39 protein [Candidatus Gottesmanbacteria bacterium]
MKTLRVLIFCLVLLILLVRFYNFPAWFGFDYDQEVNAWIAKAIVVDHKPVLIGPETSVGGMYVGPYFNYLIAIFYALGRMDPQATIILNILLSAVTVYFIYFVGTKVFSRKTGVIAMIIYGFSYNLTNFDRVAWNPTPIPVVSLGILFFLYLYFRFRKLWQLVAAISLTGFMFHLHFTAIFLGGFVLLALLVFGGKKFGFSFKNYFALFFTGLVFLLPLLIFNLRHDYLLSRHFWQFFFSSGQVQTIVWERLGILVSFTRAIFYNDASKILDIITILPLTAVLYFGFRSKPEQKLFYQLAFLLLATPILPLALYPGPLPAHYLLFALPVIILLLSSLIEKLNTIKIFLILAVFLSVNVPKILTTVNGLSLAAKHRAANFVVNNAKMDPFKVDFITQPGRKTGFKYLFWLEGRGLIENMAIKTERTYKIIVPYFLVPEKDLTAKFGGVGVIKIE